MKSSIPELEELVAKFRAGEAEVAARFFESKSPLGQHLDWLRFQVAREARNLEEIADHQRCDLVNRVDDSVVREDFVDQLTEDYQEVRHYAMLAYIYEGLSGEKVNWRELREKAKGAPWYHLSRREHGRWAELRENGSKLELAAALFTRGGGGAVFYGLIALKGGDYEFLLSEASKIILKDELEHGASEGRDELYKLIQSREDIEISKKIIVEMSRIRLHMRNEQFSGVLPERRIDEISEGSISSLSMDEMLRSCSKTTDGWFHLYHEKAKPLSAVSISG
jgi:hypothetical protein